MHCEDLRVYKPIKTKDVRKLLLLSILFISFISCSENKQEIYKRKFQVYTSEDNNWTTSGSYSCDSIKFINKNNAILWIDGSKMEIFSKLIKCYQKN